MDTCLKFSFLLLFGWDTVNETFRCIKEHHISTKIVWSEECRGRSALLVFQSEECRGQSAEYRVWKVEGANGSGWRSQGRM